MTVRFGDKTVKTYKPSDLVESVQLEDRSNSLKGILKDQTAKSIGECYVPLDPYARSLRQNFYFEEQFEVEFDGDPMHGKSRIFDSLDLECSGPNPSSSDNRDEVLLEQLAWKSLNGSLSNRKSSADAMLDLLTGFEDEYEGDTYRYDDEGELWAVDMDFI